MCLDNVKKSFKMMIAEHSKLNGYKKDLEKVMSDHKLFDSAFLPFLTEKINKIIKENNECLLNEWAFCLTKFLNQIKLIVNDYSYDMCGSLKELYLEYQQSLINSVNQEIKKIKKVIKRLKKEEKVFEKSLKVRKKAALFYLNAEHEKAA